jgi:hypothetical protein
VLKAKFVHEYYHNVVGAIDKSGVFLDRSSLGKVLTLDSGQSQVGQILAPLSGEMADPTAQPYDPSNGLVLRNGAFLNMRETVRITRDGVMEWLSYSYPKLLRFVNWGETFPLPSGLSPQMRSLKLSVQRLRGKSTA